MNKKKDKNMMELEDTLMPIDVNDLQVENKNKELEECMEKTILSENLYKRALADYQNLEKRMREERIEWIRSGNKVLMLSLLPILDTLQMANKHVDNQGLKLSIQQFLDVLKDEGAIRMQVEGKDFDPHIMECVDTVEGDDGKVIEEVRLGFMLHDKVLRPSNVKVGKKIIS
ncbi:hypothetical protein LBMAG33_6300 [Candidatus Levyibacteriota bacterium]|nr:nucleotide exchange factor GrpE [Candidatus Levybacteria bacterium]MSU25767.1 nucleotide exchange factor GrpE [Candidatus Levybacteria bacterium]GDX62320.1 hypothetical protein LBMAG33_6300 [Candidatus Levybacteria bacterium]